MILSISGQDNFRSLHKFNLVRLKATQKSVIEIEFDFTDLVTVEAVNNGLAELKSSLDHFSLFREKRLIIIRNISLLPKFFYPTITSKLELARDSADRIVLFYDSQPIPKTHPINHLLTNLQAKVEVYHPLPKAKLQSYIKQMAQAQGMILDNQTCQYISVYTEQDLHAVELILNQIYNFYQTEIINLDMVKTILPSQAKQVIFKLSEYFFKKKYADYLALLRQCQQQGEEGLIVYGYLTSQVKKALIISLAQEKGLSYLDYIQGNVYGLNKLAQLTQTWDKTALFGLYQYITRGDYAIKHQGKDVFAYLENMVFEYYSIAEAL